MSRFKLLRNSLVAKFGSTSRNNPYVRLHAYKKNCLQPEHSLRTCSMSALKCGTQYSCHTLVMVRASPPCSVLTCDR